MIQRLKIEHLGQLIEIQKSIHQGALEKSVALTAFEVMKPVIEEQLKHIIEQHYGVAWCEGDKVLAYMTGYSEIEGMKGSQKGAYTPEIGHGFVPQASVEFYIPIMEALWREWLPKGIRTHGLSYLPHQTDIRDFCFDMAYGKIVEDGVLHCNVVVDIVENPMLSVRRATKNDLETLWRWEVQLIKTLGENPIFRYGEIPSLAEVTQRYTSAFIGRDVLTLVLEEKGCIVGAIRGHYGDSTNSVWAMSKENFGIDFLWIEPNQRRHHGASILLKSLQKEAAACGMTTLSVDYETHNPKAKYFWRKHFNVFSESVLRKIDDRIE